MRGRELQRAGGEQAERTHVALTVSRWGRSQAPRPTAHAWLGCTDHIVQTKAPWSERARSSLLPGGPALTSPWPLQQQRLGHLEEKLRLLAQARDEAQATCLQQKQMVAEAQARGGQLGLQVEALRRRLEELQQVTGPSGAPSGVPAPLPPRPLTHVPGRS